MTASQLLRDKFKKSYIKNFYFNKIRYKSSPGLDRINRRTFESQLPKQIDIINRKVLNGTYEYTPYKELLILKGRGKCPRVLSLPTIRDKVTLGLLKEIIYESFLNDLSPVRLVQAIIAKLKIAISQGIYDYFFKIDIRGFYSSIDHALLLKKVRKRIKKKEIVNLISAAITTPTHPDTKSINNVQNSKGVPEGLSISNVLANIYMCELDDIYSNVPGLAYFRYVDDILVLCRKSEALKLKNKITNYITKKLLLEVHDEKFDEGLLDESFTYLGYRLENKKFTIRETSILKLELSIEKIFSEYKNTPLIERNPKLFLWKINLRITGCIKNKKKYGWVFFYSQIDPEHLSVLYKRDEFLKILCNRYKTKYKVKINPLKRFVRTYHEILFNLNNTTYIPKFDDYSIDEKKKLLGEIFKIRIGQLTDDGIEELFDKVIFSSIKDIEKDIQSLS